MNKIKYIEFDDEGRIIALTGICKAKDFKRCQND